MSRWLAEPAAGRRGDVVALGAVVAAAVLMVLSGLVHLHLWDIAYRHVATLGPLFLVQAIAALVMAVVLVVARAVIVALGCIGLMLGTVVGFILADTVGIFGFTVAAVSGWAYAALVTETLSTLVLALLVRRAWRTARWADGAALGRSVARGMVGGTS